MRVITLNVNGIRAASAKGLGNWLQAQNADVVCLQEVRAAREHIPPEWQSLTGYLATWNCSARKGYSGVALLSRIAVDHVSCDSGSTEFEGSGRLIEAHIGSWVILSIYVPSGISGPAYQERKMRFLAELLRYFGELKGSGKKVLICGDFNIAHRPVDLYHPRRHETTSGFLPEERAWMDELLSRGFVDVFRKLVGPEAAHYTWWSNFSGARSRNLGWRLDYHIATTEVAEVASAPAIDRDAVFSDHAPVAIDYYAPELEAMRLPPDERSGPPAPFDPQLELFT